MALFIDNFRNTIADLEATQANAKANVTKLFQEKAGNGSLQGSFDFISSLRDVVNKPAESSIITTGDGRTLSDANKVLQPMTDSGKPAALVNGVATFIGVDYTDADGKKHNGGIWVPTDYAKAIDSGEVIKDLPLYGFEQDDGTYIPYSDFLERWNNKEIKNFGFNNTRAIGNSDNPSLLRNPSLQSRANNLISLPNYDGTVTIRERTNPNTVRKA